MLSAGVLNKRISLLDFIDGAWTQVGSLWAQVTPKERIIYSPHSPATFGAEFIIRKATVTAYNAFVCDGQHYMIVEPFEEIEDGAGLKLSAAAVTLVECTRKVAEYTMNELNRPTWAAPTTQVFPGVLAQKYVRWEQQEPNAITDDSLILTTPKAIALASGDIVTVAGQPYAVRVCYVLSQYRNDYEIVKEADT